MNILFFVCIGNVLGIYMAKNHHKAMKKSHKLMKQQRWSSKYSENNNEKMLKIS